MSKWGINLNAEGSDERMDNLKTRASKAADWADVQFIDALTDMLGVSMKKTKESAKKDVEETVAYFAVAHRLMQFMEEQLPNAVEEFKKQFPEKAGEVETLKMRVVAGLIKKIVEGAEDLRKM